MQLEPMFQLALSVEANPGVYALLLGSGISRAAGIPTGWDIVLDLIRKVAAMTEEECEPDPATWYRQRFSEPPEYSKLLDHLTGSATDRMALLRPYFEPTEDERVNGIKAPTTAHKAIGELVDIGCVRLILTTNFDRLLELALNERGVYPDVIDSDDKIKGATPYAHSRCVVLKLHGDYLDARIRNTPEELEAYSPELDGYLDRVLDDFGLIIAGWSGVWDIALRKAILRAPNRRYATFWLARSPLEPVAQDIFDNRRAIKVAIADADAAFTSLVEKVVSLRQIAHPHPLSVPAAVATVKRYLVDDLHRIRLDELLRDETEDVHARLTGTHLGATGSNPTYDAFQERLKQYQAITDRLIAMLTAIAYYGDARNTHLITRSVARLAADRPIGGMGTW
ncbi:MAG: SIR2 family protein, partial [Chloroflexota bacterium]